jgi:hypothetical protein
MPPCGRSLTPSEPTADQTASPCAYRLILLARTTLRRQNAKFSRMVFLSVPIIYLLFRFCTYKKGMGQDPHMEHPELAEWTYGNSTSNW